MSNPAFQKDAQGNYVANPFDTTATNFSAHFMAPVERTYSEWLHSDYNTPTGVLAPQFAGNKPGGTRLHLPGLPHARCLRLRRQPH